MDELMDELIPYPAFLMDNFYSPYDARKWTLDEVREVLPRLRSMRSLENAWLDIQRECLVIRTAKGILRHRLSLFRLAQLDIQIPMRGKAYYGSQRPRLKYVGGRIAAFFNPHPSMKGNRIGKQLFSAGCIGDYQEDYYKAHERNVYETVLVLVTMLQTIKPE